MGVKKMTEAAFQKAVIQFACIHGWASFHQYDSRRSEAGFPDLVLMRGPGHAVRLVVAELKLKGKKPTAAQYAWLGAFQASSIQTFVWTPDSWPEIERTLGN